MKFIKQLLILLVVVLTGSAMADIFPTKPIRIVTNLPVGSAPDVFIRKAAVELEKKYAVPVVTENKPGAGGIVAMEYYLSLPADGHTIFMGDFGAAIIMPILYNRKNLVEQLAPLTSTYSNHWVIITPSDIKTIEDLRTALKANPKFGSWGVGTSGHLCGQELSLMLGVDAIHVPYKEYGPWFIDVINGVLPFSCASLGSTQNYQKSGKMNYIVTTGSQRDALYPDIPTVKELTKNEFQVASGWVSLFVNKKVDPAISRKLEKDLREIMSSNVLKEQAKTIGGAAWAPTSAELSQVIQYETKTYSELIKKYNITVN
jgi:tripartite-type tricarboxylate transporter receptor subunit TctC